MYEQDPAVKEAFSFSCDVAAGRANHSASCHDVSMRQDTGMTVFSDCILLTDAQYKAHVAPPGASALNPSDAGERLTEVSNEHHGEK
eukprot:4770575-Pyramimonas_sp.AAC.1